MHVELGAGWVEGEAEQAALARTGVGDCAEVDERRRVDGHVPAGHVQDPHLTGSLGDEEVVGPGPAGHGDGVGQHDNRLEGQLGGEPALWGRSGTNGVAHR